MRHPIAAARPTLALGLLAFAAACGGGGGGYGGGSPTQPPTPPPANAIVVEIRDFEFVPKSITVSPGDTVTWKLTGSAGIGHTVTAAGVFDSGAAFNATGATFSHTFTSADTGKTIAYYCITHQVCCLMQGSIRVGETAPPPPPGY